jgi:hypothetical protein
MSPDFTTFTGADDKTSVDDMLALSADHDVEFAILFSTKQEGNPRYPTQAWMDNLNGVDLSLAAHICGGLATEIIETGRSFVHDQMGSYDRIQINTGLELNMDLICDWKKSLSDDFGRDFRIILQTRGDFPEDPRVEWLFDASGGKGISPESWPAAPVNENVRFGYAGGLGPDNVEAALAAIPADRGFWIDMETRVRNLKDEFDFDMCRKVCELVEDDV